MPPAAWGDPAVAHALAVRSALALGNYAAFFALHAAAPNMGGYILDMFADAVRVDAAAAILRAYRPTLSVAALAVRLGFGDGADDVAEAKAYAAKLGFVFDAATGEHVLCKESKCDPAGLDTGEKSSLL